MQPNETLTSAFRKPYSKSRKNTRNHVLSRVGIRRQHYNHHNCPVKKLCDCYGKERTTATNKKILSLMFKSRQVCYMNVSLDIETV